MAVRRGTTQFDKFRAVVDDTEMITTLYPDDVLLGRGSCINEYVGNQVKRLAPNILSKSQVRSSSN